MEDGKWGMPACRLGGENGKRQSAFELVLLIVSFCIDQFPLKIFTVGISLFNFPLIILSIN